MGALLDSTYLVEAERAGLSPVTALRDASTLAGTTELGISVITIMEMAHGEARAESHPRAEMRSKFLSELMQVLSIHPITPEIARRAGLLDGQLARSGQKLAMADVLIASTALALDCAVITRNIRHFNRIPGLRVTVHP